MSYYNYYDDYDDYDYDDYDDEGECIICGTPTEHEYFDYCYTCYYEYKEVYNKYKNLKKNDLINTINQIIENDKKINDYNNHNSNLIKLYALKDIINLNYKNISINIDSLINQNKNIFNNNKSSNDFRLKYDTEFRTDDGHYVRSKGEQIIDNWLYYHNITHAYEKQLTINGINYKPDFYLPQYNIYIEFWGMNNNKYNQKRTEKENEFGKAKIKYIGIDENILKNLDDYLEKNIK